jgi:ammonia channel protein AmtB
MVIGACAGALVVLGARLLDRLKIDDPVCRYCCNRDVGILPMLVLFGTQKLRGILRVSEADELAGLDGSEHGMHAYSVSFRRATAKR